MLDSRFTLFKKKSSIMVLPIDYIQYQVAMLKSSNINEMHHWIDLCVELQDFSTGSLIHCQSSVQ